MTKQGSSYIHVWGALCLGNVVVTGFGRRTSFVWPSTTTSTNHKVPVQSTQSQCDTHAAHPTHLRVARSSVHSSRQRRPPQPPLGAAQCQGEEVSSQSGRAPSTATEAKTWKSLSAVGGRMWCHCASATTARFSSPHRRVGGWGGCGDSVAIFASPLSVWYGAVLSVTITPMHSIRPHVCGDQAVVRVRGCAVGANRHDTAGLLALDTRSHTLGAAAV